MSEDEEYSSHLKKFLDNYHIPYHTDKKDMRIIRIDITGLQPRKVKRIRQLIEVDNFQLDSIGFNMISVNLGHYGGLK